VKNILAIDTSSERLSVACLRRDGALAEVNLEAGYRHSERLVMLIDAALRSARVAKHELDVIACGIGPGSFTGLRIGISHAKGLALGLGRRVCAFSSLDAIAEAIPPAENKLAVALDARRGAIYAAVYQSKGGRVVKLLKDSLVTIDQLLKRLPGRFTVTGDALGPYGREIEARSRGRAVLLDKLFWRPSAAAVLRGVQSGNVQLTPVSLRALKPAYLRLSEAEERRLARKS
jgi:tRNA threonylcarbamoyladenosine biosynthesis protein TsaB